MPPPSPPPVTADGLLIGRGALRQLHRSLARDAAGAAITILQEAGLAAGDGLYRAFCAWLAECAGVARPQELDAGQLNGALADFFQTAGWGRLSLAPLGDAALALDAAEWAESDPGSAAVPMCFFSAGMLSDFFGRLSGEPVAVMEVECRSKNDARCRFLSASPDTLNAVYQHMTQGMSYEEALTTAD